VERAGFVVEKCTHANMWLFPLAAAKRLAERIRPPSNPTASDLVPLPGPINTVFRWVLCSEAALIRRWELPFGLSLLALARKPAVAVRPATPLAPPEIAVRPEPRAPAGPPAVGASRR
jgi:hypothetical protein